MPISYLFILGFDRLQDTQSSRLIYCTELITIMSVLSMS